MIRVHCFLIARYAAVTTDNSLTVSGTIDTLMAQRAPGAPPEALQNIPLPPCFLALVTEASIGDGLVHPCRLRILDGGGDMIAPESQFSIEYALNQYGRPMRNSIAIGLNGLVFPGGPDDYVFELRLDSEGGRVLAEFTFSVMDVTPPEP
jgi:hypothetical protein